MQKLAPPKFSFKKVIEWDEHQHIILPRLEAASKLDIKHLPQLEAHDGQAIIAGAGPTLALHINELTTLRSSNELSTLFSVNAAHNWLIERQIIPNIHVIFEDDLDEISVAIGGMPHSDTTYFLASHLHPNLFRDLKGYRCVLWHPFLPVERYQQAIDRIFPGEFMVGGGMTTFFRTLTIAFILGYRKFDLFGVDGSFEQNSHVDDYKLSNIEQRINIWGRDPRSDTLRQFTSQGGLVFQTCEFLEFCKEHQNKISLCVHGDSLMRYVHESRYPEQY